MFTNTMEMSANIQGTLVLEHQGATHLRYQVDELDTTAWGGSLNLVLEHSLDGIKWYAVGTSDDAIVAAGVRQGAKDVTGVPFSRLRNSVVHASAKRLQLTLYAEKQ